MELIGLIVKLVLFMICAYFVYKLGSLLVVLVDYMTFLNIAFGGSTSSTSLLHLYVCPVEKLDHAAFEELNNFLKQLGEVSLDSESIRNVLTSAYSHVVLVRRRADGSLQGFSYYAKERDVLNGRKYTLLKIGTTVFNYNYRRNALPF